MDVKAEDYSVMCALHPPEKDWRYKYLCHMVIQKEKDMSAVQWRAAYSAG